MHFQVWLAGTNHRDFGFIFVSVRIFRKKRPSCHIWLKGKMVRTKSGEVHNGTLKYHITPIAPIKKAYDEKELDKLRREAEMRERIAKYERHTKNSVHAENHAENGQM